MAPFDSEGGQEDIRRQVTACERLAREPARSTAGPPRYPRRGRHKKHQLQVGSKSNLKERLLHERDAVTKLEEARGVHSQKGNSLESHDPLAVCGGGRSGP